MKLLVGYNNVVHLKVLGIPYPYDAGMQQVYGPRPGILDKK